MKILNNQTLIFNQIWDSVFHELFFLSFFGKSRDHLADHLTKNIIDHFQTRFVAWSVNMSWDIDKSNATRLA